ncbi:DUF11 domain-containing protein, partial [bacterium]|nr:DUF11 domain-containing protein [bacterium]
FTTQTGNVNDPANSDANPTTGETAPVTLTPGQKNPNIDAGLIVVPPPPVLFDWGDLPDASGVTNPNGPEYNTDSNGITGPSHRIIETLFMGATVDAETNGQPSADATGDDVNGTPDDEDGVTLPVFLAGNPATVAVTVTNNTGVAATLYGFIDFNGDGDFDDTGEVVTATVANGTNGVVNLTFNVPLDADSVQELGARFRLSTDAGLGPDGPAGDGEVEDYLIRINVFDLALRKQLAAGQPASVEPGDDVTFTLTVFNQGTVDAFNIEVVDYLSADLQLSPVDTNNWTADGSNVVKQIASLAAGQQATLNIVLRVSADFRGDELINWAEISKGDDDTNPNNTPPVDIDSTPDKTNQNTPGEQTGTFVDDEVGQNGKTGGDEDDHDPAIITVDQLPAILVTKTLETPNPVSVGAEITFSIRITNTGPTTIVTLPLSDTYEAEFITFVRGIPPHDRATTGEVEWFDLTTVFGDLAPGASVEVKVVFTADKPTPTTINVATVVNALDEDDKPSGSGSSTGVIIQDPTVVELLSFTAIGVNESMIQVSWVTGLEIDTWGFHIWRSETGNRADAVKVTTQLVPAQGSANSGGSYSVLDSGVRPGVTYTYWLAETQTDGIILEYGPVTGRTGEQPFNNQRIFLPVVGR